MDAVKLQAREREGESDRRLACRGARHSVPRDARHGVMVYWTAEKKEQRRVDDLSLEFGRIRL